MSPSLSVVICSYNGSARLGLTLGALAVQTVRADLEIIVVDDASTDATSDVARAGGATVVGHEVNRGAAAARDTGLRTAAAPVVAFLDDDCEPGPRWAETLLSGYTGDDVAGVGGPIVPATGAGFLARFLERDNRHQPLELELTVSAALPYRLWLYLRRQWRPRAPRNGRRDVYAFSGGNMSFRRDRLLAAGGFDPRFRHAAEEEDLSRRLRRHGAGRLVFVPDAPVLHHCVPTLRGLLRRSLAYGRGAAMQYLKWPGVRPTLFPWPVLVALLALTAVASPVLAVVPVLLPLLLYPAGVRHAVTGGGLESLADPYVKLAQETGENLGFLHGLWAFRGGFEGRGG
ncbi:glycosyltransferase [Nonomuraea sp. NN258]|uniref:glycosyltransferase family 2 protein n=1 Tax=Nonomuraea antri TaxID=2730852 RepID=UPI0015680042|nr:glycosyltransferase family 2 protein [Nonomuraea antri]NRQ32318.1 glycosyltransferase [Nonomuraea antri]